MTMTGSVGLEIDVFGVEDVQRFFAGRCSDDVEPLAAQDSIQHVAQDFFVVDNQNSHQAHATVRARGS
jgi:hypothetical protein